MNEQVLDALKRARYRVIDDAAGLETVERLRYKSYLAEGAILPSDDARMQDAFDGLANCVNVAVEIEDRILAAVRLHLVTRVAPMSPTLSVFPEILEHVSVGKTVLDPSRLIVDPEARRHRMPLHFLALRIPAMAALFYDVDIVLAPIRPEHAAFYSRYLGHRKVIEARGYPGLRTPLQLMMTDVGRNRESILARTPFFGPVDALPGANIDFPRLAAIRRLPSSSDAA